MGEASIEQSEIIWVKPAALTRHQAPMISQGELGVSLSVLPHLRHRNPSRRFHARATWGLQYSWRWRDFLTLKSVWGSVFASPLIAFDSCCRDFFTEFLKASCTQRTSEETIRWAFKHRT